MPTHPYMLLAYDANDDVVGTLDYMVQYDAERRPIGLVDFAAHEEAGGEHTAIWVAEGAVGSKVWPEWIGPRAPDFRVERDGPPGAKRIVALVHKVSGHRRERAAVEAAIGERIAANRAEADAKAVEIRSALPDEIDEKGELLPKPEVVVEPEPADIRDLVGGPDRPLILDDEGKTIGRSPEAEVTPLPLIGVTLPTEDQPARAEPAAETLTFRAERLSSPTP